MEVPHDVHITCAGGLKARMLELEQHSTYRGLLDGAPSHELNEQLLSHITTQGRIPVHLVRPAETTVERTGADQPVVRLPERQCTGLFEAGTHWLTIVWFQDSWAPPIGPAVLAEVRSLDFTATGFDEVSTW